MTGSEPEQSAAARFEAAYRDGPAWEIDGPQPEVIALAEAGKIHGRVLDAGCGTGNNARWLAARGFPVVAFDFVSAPLEVARQRSRESGVGVDWRRLDALELSTLDEKHSFDTIIDSGLFHVFPADIRRRYVAGLKHVLAPSGMLHVICFSDRQPGEEGPLRISERELRYDFRPPWEIVELVETRYACRLLRGGPRHDGRGARAWRASIQYS